MAPAFLKIGGGKIASIISKKYFQKYHFLWQQATHEVSCAARKNERAL
jgi:hypothetical protein